MSILAELRRRNVTRAAAAYGALCWLLIQIAGATLPAFGFSDGAQRIVIIALAIGFVPAMVLAWIFEITPEGLKREEELDRDEPLRQRTNRALDRVIMGLLALALCYFAVDKFLLAPQREAKLVESAAERATRETLRDARGKRSIVVLPFANLSSDPEQAYFSDGITEELLNLLAKIPELSVISRTSAFAFKGKQLGVTEIARQLDVVYVLEGSVRKSGERVRITTQLIDTRTDTHLWSEVYERTLVDLFAVQDDVAAKVVAELQLKLLGAAPHTRPVDAEAYTHYLKARQLLASWVVADAEAAIEHLQQAIAIAPDYAAAFALLADAMSIRAAGGGAEETEARKAEAPLLEKALALDPELGEAYVSRGRLHDDPVAAEADIRRGLALNPSYARGYEVLAGTLAGIPGRDAEAFAAIDRALSLDPLSPRNHHMKATMLMIRGDTAGVEVLEKQALALDPRFRSALARLGQMYGDLGRFAEAIALDERALAIDPRALWIREDLLNLYLAIGDVAAAREVHGDDSAGNALDILLAAGDGQGAGEALYALDPAAREQFPTNLLAKIVLAHAARTGDFARARDVLAARLHYTGEIAADADIFSLVAYAELAWLFGASGEKQAAERLLKDVRASLDRIGQSEVDWSVVVDTCRALVLAAGDKAAAIAALEHAWQPAPHSRWWWYQAGYPPFDSLRGEPRYQALLASGQAHMTHEREKLEAMRRSGEIPQRAAPAVE